MRKFVLAMTALMLSATTASAAVTELSIEKDLSHNLIEINGKALPNESVGFQVLPEGMTLQDFAQSDSKNDIIAFVYECKADAKGMFSVKAVINDSGEYNVNVASGDINVAAIPKSVDFYTSDIYAEKIRLVNEAKENNDLTSQLNFRQYIAGEITFCSFCFYLQFALLQLYFQHRTHTAGAQSTDTRNIRRNKAEYGSRTDVTFP